jgi:hypothetical protein
MQQGHRQLQPLGVQKTPGTLMNRGFPRKQNFGFFPENERGSEF